MLTFLIPTAKDMAPTGPNYPQDLSKKSCAIVGQLANLSIQELATTYKITFDLAQKEASRLKELESGAALNYPALYLFNGLMYRNIKRDLSTDEIDYISQHICITSSLYGIIPAFHPIAPHRLDFNTKIKINGQSLKAYWRLDYEKFATESDTIISLLSSEFEQVFSTETRHTFLSLKFMEEKNGHLKVHSTISKKARGKFLSAAIENKSETLEDLKKLTFDGFAYQKNFSDNQRELVFIKNNNTPASDF